MILVQVAGSECRGRVVRARALAAMLFMCAAVLAWVGCDDGSADTTDAGTDATEVGCQQPPPECLNDRRCGQPCCFLGEYESHCGSMGELQSIACQSGIWVANTTWDDMSCVPPGARP
jgi:hypothetical protein